MFRTTENQDSFYRISCADWEYICLADSHYEASVIAIKKMIKMKGNKLNISFTLISDKILDLDIEREFFYCPLVLSDAGFKEVAKNLSDLSDFFLDIRCKAS